LRDILASTGVQKLAVEINRCAREGLVALVLGTGYRGTIEQLDTEARQ